MRRLGFVVPAIAALLIAAIRAQGPAAERARQWPSWRGPSHDGVSRETGLPVRWSATEGVDWTLPLPSYSGSTPIVWGDLVFLNVATAVSSGRLELWAIDRTTRSVAWKRPLAAGNRVERKQNMSSPSPVTDGRHVWAMTGVGVLKAFDFAGDEIWSRDIQKDYGRFGLNWGYASSPLLDGDALYVQVLHGMKTDDPSYLLRLDALTGRTVWRVERPTRAERESPDAYTTPTLLQYDGRTEIVVTGGDVATGHDPATGREIWRAGGLNPTHRPDNRMVPSPLVAGGLLVVPTRGGGPVLAFRPGGQGDVTTSHLAWTFGRGPDVPTPVSDGTYLYVLIETGILYCVNLSTGAVVYGPERLPDVYSASPVIADGRIYVTSETTGVTSVFRTGPVFERIASNSFGEDCSPYCLSSIAVSEGQLFIRSASHLWVVGQRRLRDYP